MEVPIGTRRADFVVEGKILVELKAIIQLEDVHLAQALNYLKAYKLEVGLLINFGCKSLTFKRLVLWIEQLNIKYRKPHSTTIETNPCNALIREIH